MTPKQKAFDLICNIQTGRSMLNEHAEEIAEILAKEVISAIGSSKPYDFKHSFGIYNYWKDVLTEITEKSYSPTIEYTKL